MNASRVPRGVPAGGQFAELARSESDVDLGVSSDELTPEQMLWHSRRSASHHMKSVAMASTSAVEDVAQEAMYAALKARANDPSIIITVAYLHSVTRAQANLVRRGLLSQRDYKAAGILSRYIREAREDGTEPTSQQISDWAHQIRMDTPVAHRPSAEFAELMQVTEVPLDHTVDAEAAHVDMESVDVSAPVVAGLEVAEGDKPARRDLDAVRSNVWSYLGDDTSPRPAERSMSWKRTAAVKKSVDEAGGVLSVAQEWSRGERTETGRAVLSLFGEGTSGDEVFATFLRHPDYAERLLASALSSARR